MTLRLLLSTIGLISLCVTGTARAQSNDGMHSTMVLPIVVDTPSYNSRIEITNPLSASSSNDADVVVWVRFVPADGTGQAASGAIYCNTVIVKPLSMVTFDSLRALCPNLAAGSNFGYLSLTRGATARTGFNPASVHRGFHAYSRVSNPSGIGFSVEGYPEAAFGSGPQIVLGPRRMARTATAPALQTNCFIATFSDFPASGVLRLRLTQNDAQSPMTYQDMVLGPDRMVRLLDVFASLSGETTIDREGFAFVANHADPNVNASFMSFCTVQDNDSYGADFRIAKPYGFPRNDHRQRVSELTTDGLGIPMSIAPSGADVYHLNFQVPDEIGCELVNATTKAPLTVGDGVELHLRWQDGSSLGLPVPGGGGHFMQGFNSLALDGSDPSYGETNPGYLLVVQSYASSNLQYGLTCRSGGGHSMPHLVQRSSSWLIE